MRIALLHFKAAPVVGGVEQVMAQHERLLRDDGHQVVVLAGMALRGNGLAEFDLVFAHNLLTMQFRPEVTRSLWESAAAGGRTRFVSWVHDVAAASPDYDVSGDPLLRRGAPNFEWVAVSELRRRQLREAMHVPLAACRVIPNGVWPLEQWGLGEEWWPFAEKTRLLERDLVLLHPARLVRRKNIDVSLRVTAALRAAGCDAALLATAPADAHQARGAAYAEELHQLRLELGLKNDAFFLSNYQPLADDDLRAFYRLADAVLFPSREEGFGLPLLEAALHRTPLFAPRIAPFTDILPVSATYYETGADPQEIAALLRHRLAGVAAIQARKLVAREYAWPAIYQKFILPLLEGRGASTIP